MYLLKPLLFFIITVCIVNTVVAQNDDYTRTPQLDTTQKNLNTREQPPTWWQKNKNKFSAGGNLGIAYSNGFSVLVSPLISYKLTNYVTLGNTFNFAYYDNISRYNLPVMMYGVSPFVRVFPLPMVFLHTEYENNYIKIVHSPTPVKTTYIYSWLVGAGVKYPIGGKFYATLTGLWVAKTNYVKFYQNPIIRGGIIINF
ncbi:MAG: hypothetical protein H7331_05510 [Bacteroidia bacterium]|nr:hypothetical protein [Bacteroidia bacterium]